MDYIFFSAIFGITLLSIMISYDIVCQWKIHLVARSAQLPEHLRQDSSDLPPLAERLKYGIPVWHAGAHEDKCQVANSLRYQPGAGHTDGEGIERGWSRVNPHASSTKEMGAGARQDALDDVFAHHNFERNVGLGVFPLYPPSCYSYFLQAPHYLGNWSSPRKSVTSKFITSRRSGIQLKKIQQLSGLRRSSHGTAIGRCPTPTSYRTLVCVPFLAVMVQMY